jgi:Tol biopolymer transport system component
MIIQRKIALLFIVVLFTGRGLLAQPYVESHRLSFNTPSKELAPAFYHNGLVFCSDRKRDLFPSYVDMTNSQFTNLYLADQKKPGKFENPVLLSKDLTTYLFEGPSCFSKDGNTIYFTRTIDVSSSKKNKQREDTTFGIFSATKVRGKWSSVTPFRYNKPDCHTGYPCLSEDGSLLFFCSDGPDGLGGYDIYVSKRENGQWGKPENLGSNINTDKNEVFPFLHHSGRLYFASRGHHQKNDLEIYYTVNENGTWQKPVALESPYNSAGDDYGFIVNAAMDTGYFVSDRDGSADIFSAYSSIPTFVNCTPQEENEYCYVFYEPNDSELDTTIMAYEWDLGDGTKIRKLKAEHCYSKPGNYLVQLNVVDLLTNQVALNQASDSFLVEDVEQPYITAADTIQAGHEFTLDAKNTFLKNYQVSGYYWDFGDGYRSSGEKVKHTFLYPGIYQMQLGVSGKKTDPAILEDPKKCSTRQIVVIKAE